MLSSPYVAGDKDTETDAEKVFVIENIVANSPVARITLTPIGTSPVVGRDTPAYHDENYI